MMPHSPGPWHPSELLPCPGDYICDNNGNVIAAVAEFNPDGSLHFRFDDAVENARLIAAAPELLEVAKRCEAMVSTDQGPPDWDWIRSVVSKATR